MTFDPTDPYAGAPVTYVGESTRDRVVVTFKAHGGYDAPWVVFHADSNAEAADLIGAAEATGLFSIIAKAGESFKGFFNVGQTLGGTPQTAPGAAQSAYQAQGGAQYQQQAPQAQNGPPPGVVAPTCPHGTKNYVPGGISKTSNKPYSAFWGCPAPQGDPSKCRPEWVK